MLTTRAIKTVIKRFALLGRPNVRNFHGEEWNNGPKFVELRAKLSSWIVLNSCWKKGRRGDSMHEEKTDRTPLCAREMMERNRQTCVPKYPHNSCRSAYLPCVSHTTTAANELAKNFLPHSSINSPRIIIALVINLTKRISSSSDTSNVHSCDFVKIIGIIITFTNPSHRVNWKTSSTQP